MVIGYVMRIALLGMEGKLGFQLREIKSKRVPHIIVTDMKLADDIVLVYDIIKEAQELLTRVDKCIELRIRTGKTKYTSYNTNQGLKSKLLTGKL